IASVAVWADSPDEERAAALRELAAGRVRVVFSVDLFNEGVDVPTVDTLLFLRPTDSPTLFLQQLGRGLRRSHAKASCTVLHVDDHERIELYRRLLRADGPPALATLSERERRLVRMLVAQLGDQVLTKDADLETACALLWRHPGVRAEVAALMDVLAERIDH